MVGLVALAYREPGIEDHVRYWRRFVDEYLLLISATPWNGPAEPMDNTAALARRAGATVLIGEWPNEETQRNTGMGYFAQAEKVWQVDPDEYLSPKDIRLLNSLPPGTYGPALTTTYWKDGYKLVSRDNHVPLMLTTPDTRFIDARCIAGGISAADVRLHHFSFNRSDQEIARKLASYAHAQDVRDGWYEAKWRNWTPDTTDLHPTQENAWERAIPAKRPRWLP